MTKRLIIIVSALLALYLASPYFSFWRFSAAVQNGDTAALESRVDFEAVRAGLKQQLRDQFVAHTKDKPKSDRLSGIISNLAPNLIDTIVDAYVTPSGIAALLAHPPNANAIHNLADLQQQQQGAPAGGEHHGVDWSRVHYAFFTAPGQFMVDAEGMKLRFGFTGFGWRLKRIELPFPAAKK